MRTIILICDRCGRQYASWNNIKDKELFGIAEIDYSDFEPMLSTKMDLCESCYHSFEKWWKDPEIIELEGWSRDPDPNDKHREGVRMMKTLDEYIKDCEEAAEKQEITAKSNLMEVDKIKADGILRLYDADAYESCMKCASEHRQLAEWLKELKYYKDNQDLINKDWQELIRYKDGIEKNKNA